MFDLDWKIGVEIELLAPRGQSRAALAHALAARCGGSVRRTLHADSEPSKVPGQPLFHNLTPAFDVERPDGALWARCVDDLTLQDDLDRQARPQPGWWRMVGDDERLLRLLALHVDPARDLPAALERLPALCGGQLLAADQGMYRLLDACGAPLAIAAPLPGERERPCELITAPLRDNHAAQLEALLQPARDLGFTRPREGATHLHFDAAALCAAHTLANLVNLLSGCGPMLRRWVDTPKHFRRVGGWPASLLHCVNTPEFRGLPWDQAQARLRALELSKYCDFNLRNIAYGRADRHTFEVRIFPTNLTVAPIMAWAALFAAILRHCQSAVVIPPADATMGEALALDPARQHDWLEALRSPPAVQQHWQQRIDALAAQPAG